MKGKKKRQIHSDNNYVDPQQPEFRPRTARPGQPQPSGRQGRQELLDHDNGGPDFEPGHDAAVHGSLRPDEWSRRMEKKSNALEARRPLAVHLFVAHSATNQQLRQEARENSLKDLQMRVDQLYSSKQSTHSCCDSIVETRQVSFTGCVSVCVWGGEMLTFC